MLWEWIVLVAVAILAVVLFCFRKNPYVKRYWKYSLILLPAVFIIILRLVNRRKDNTGNNPEKDKALAGTIEKIKDDLQETHLETAIEISAAKAKSSEKIKELEKIKQEPDQKKRIERLAGMIG